MAQMLAKSQNARRNSINTVRLKIFLLKGFLFYFKPCEWTCVCCAGGWQYRNVSQRYEWPMVRLGLPPDAFGAIRCIGVPPLFYNLYRQNLGGI